MHPTDIQPIFPTSEMLKTSNYMPSGSDSIGKEECLSSLFYLAPVEFFCHCRLWQGETVVCWVLMWNLGYLERVGNDLGYLLAWHAYVAKELIDKHTVEQRCHTKEWFARNRSFSGHYISLLHSRVFTKRAIWIQALPFCASSFLELQIFEVGFCESGTSPFVFLPFYMHR